jgi:hypothetical protein
VTVGPVRLLWGAEGLGRPGVRVLVDVLTFCTRADLALGGGAERVPVAGDGSDAELAGAAAAAPGPLYAACLRNAVAVADAVAAEAAGRPVVLVPAGQRLGDGTLRPAAEDLVAAGALALLLPGPRCARAEAAARSFVAQHGALRPFLDRCAVEGGDPAVTAELLDAAAACDASPIAPRWDGDGFVAVRSRGT